MSLPEIAIRRPVFAWMLMAGLIIFGLLCGSRIGVSQLPDVDFPTITINVTYPGAAPEIVETDVVDVLENAVMTVEGVRSVASNAAYSSATLIVEFDLNRDLMQAFQDLQNKVSAAQRVLPKDILPPVLSKTNPEDKPIIWLALSSDRHKPLELMRYVKDGLKDKFSSVPGVGDIVLGGYVEPNLRIWVSEKNLKKYEFTITDIINAIQKEHSELPAGQISSGIKEYDMRTLGEATTPQEFGALIINQRGTQPVYSRIALDQVAKIEEGLADVRSVSRSNGNPAVGIGIRKQPGSNAVAVAHGVKEMMAEISQHLPPGMTLTVNFDSTTFIEDSIGEFKYTLIVSALVTSLVCWLFIGSWTATLNVILAIPTSIIGTFIALHLFNFTLNTFTLLGLSLAIGIVVDDAIVVLENIMRHREAGQSRFLASLNGTREIALAAAAATFAIIAVFLPVAFMQGVIGKYFFQFGVTVTVAVLLSLLEALTLTPMRSSQFIQIGSRVNRIRIAADSALHVIAEFYRRVLDVSLRHPWKVVICSTVLFTLSLIPIKFVNKEFSPTQDQGALMVKIETPADTSLNYANSKFLEAEQFFRSRSEVARIYSAVGNLDGSGRVNAGFIYVSLKPKGQRGIDMEVGHELSQQEFANISNSALQKIDDAYVSIQDLSRPSFGAYGAFPIALVVQGPDWAKLGDYSATIANKLMATGLLSGVDTDYHTGKQELQIVPDRAKAAMRGVSVDAIAQTVNAAFGGVVAGRYSSGGHRYDIRVRLQEEEIDRAERVKGLFVRNNRGELIALSDVTQLQERGSLSEINRYNRERAVWIWGNVKAEVSQEKALKATQEIARDILPSDYHVQFVGGSQLLQESFRNLTVALLLGLLVSFMLLASQFNSFVHPATVLMALPFSVSGAFLTLWLFGQSLNIYSFIGLILLMGIAKKNSILLVDFTNQVRNKGEKSIHLALLHACPIRLRPILMTSLATIAGALPLAFAIGPGAETRIPMALTVIGGVAISTVLTLFVVPCVYKLLSHCERVHHTDISQELHIAPVSNKYAQPRQLNTNAEELSQMSTNDTSI